MKMKFLAAFLMLLAINAQSLKAGLTDGLVAYYPFDGSAQDFSGSNYHGTLVGDPVSTTDRFGHENGAYLFDGVNDRIDITGFNLQYNQLSASAWVLLNSNNTTGSPEIICTPANNGAFQLEIGDAGNGLNSIMWDCLNIDNRLRTGTNLFTLGTWHLVTATWDGVTSKIYYDGVQVASKTVSGTMTLSNATLRIGSEISGTSSFWDGKIDEVRLYSRGLTQEEVDELFVGGPSAISEAPVKSFKMTSYPNPFNPATSINFTLPSSSEIELNVYDAKGSLTASVAKGCYASGSHSVQFNAADCNSGIYFVRLKVDGKLSATDRIMLIK